MSRLPTPPDLRPDQYEAAARERADTLGELIGELDGVDYLSSVVTLAASDMIDLILAACKNDVRGTNVVPHLLASLDALADDLRRVLGALARPATPEPPLMPRQLAELLLLLVGKPGPYKPVGVAEGSLVMDAYYYRMGESDNDTEDPDEQDDQKRAADYMEAGMALSRLQSGTSIEAD